MSIFEKLSKKQQKDPFEQKTIEIFSDVRKVFFCKEGRRKNTVDLPTLLLLETWRIVFFVAMIVFFVIAVIITIVGIQRQFQIDILEKVVTLLLKFAVLWEMIALVLFFVEKSIRDKPKITKTIEEIEKYIIECYKNRLKMMIDLKKQIDHDFALDYIKLCLEEKIEEVKSAENRISIFMPFLALGLTLSSRIFFDFLEQNDFIAAVPGIGVTVLWLERSFKLLSGSDSPRLTWHKEYMSIVKTMNIVDKLKTNLESQLARGKFLTTEVNPQEQIHIAPQMKYAGIFANDSTFDDWLEKLAVIRQQANGIDDEE